MLQLGSDIGLWANDSKVLELYFNVKLTCLVVGQDNEPITLDDTDSDEEAGPGPSSLAAAPQLRRSERQNMFMGPSQRFQVHTSAQPVHVIEELHLIALDIGYTGK